MQPRLRCLRVPITLLTLMAAGVLIAACGGSSANNSTTTTAGQAHAQAIKFAQCMRSNGVPNFPDPQNGSGFQINMQQNGSGGSVSVDGSTLNVSAPAFQAAQKKCQKYMPQGPSPTAAQLAKVRQQALKMAQCMRSHGVPNFPDPQVSTGPNGHGIAMKIGVGAGGGGRLNPQSPAFQKAQKQCAPLMRGVLKKN